MAYKVIVKPTSNAVSQSEFARVIGVKQPTVWEMKANDKLVIQYSSGHDKILVEESIAKLNAEMSLHKQFTENGGDTEIVEDISQLDLEVTNALQLYNNARALKEKALALQADVDYKKAIGVLVERDAVERILFERARQFRDGNRN